MCTTDLVEARTAGEVFGPVEAREIETACSLLREHAETVARLRAYQEFAWNEGVPVHKIPGREACAEYEDLMASDEQFTAVEIVEKVGKSVPVMRRSIVRLQPKVVAFIARFGARPTSTIVESRAARRTPSARGVVASRTRRRTTRAPSRGDPEPEPGEPSNDIAAVVRAS